MKPTSLKDTRVTFSLCTFRCHMKVVSIPISASVRIEVSCNETSRMFSDSEGPKAKVTFTCVGGVWVGQSQEWEQLENLTCHECIQAREPHTEPLLTGSETTSFALKLQVGTPDLQRFSNVSLAAVYFMEHRQEPPYKNPSHRDSSNLCADILKTSLLR